MFSLFTARRIIASAVSNTGTAKIRSGTPMETSICDFASPITEAHERI